MPVKREELIIAYNLLLKGIEKEVSDYTDKAYDEMIYAGKGLMVENLCRNIIEIAWSELGNKENRLSLEKQSIRIPIRSSYLKKIKNEEVKKYIHDHIHEYFYDLKTDIHVYIDGMFRIAVECKTFTENETLKRTLVDFTLFKTQYSSLDCVLFQLESQMGGDYSHINRFINYGSETTHTLLSYFDVELNVITILEGERKKETAYREDYYKELTDTSVDKAVNTFKNILSKY
jgi:hypothetical protein